MPDVDRHADLRDYYYRVIDTGGGGIQFNTDNEGGWLYVQANDTTEDDGSTRGYAIDLQDRSTSVGGSGGIRLNTFNNLKLESNDSATLISHLGVVTIESDAVIATPTPGLLIKAPTADVNMIGLNVHLQSFSSQSSLTLGSLGDVVLSGSSSMLLTSAGTLDIKSTSGGGILMRSDGGGGMQIYEAGGGLLIDETGGGIIITETTGGVFINVSSGGFAVQCGDGVELRGGPDGGGDGVILRGVAADVRVKLPSGKRLYVTNASGGAIFQVDEDGDLHGKTGKALTFDL